MKKFLTLPLLMIVIALLALPVSAQEIGTKIDILDQVSVNGMVNVESVTLDQPGFVAIYADNGQGAPGDVVGFLSMESGTYPDVWVPIDATLATPVMYAMVHIDDNEIGTFEYGTVEGADAPVTAEGEPLVVSFNIAAIHAFDQLVADEQIVVTSVTSPQDGWLAIHADESGAPGPLLGYAAVSAGTTTDLSIALSDEATSVVWPVLHADTGATGEFEFGTVEGADEPITVGNQDAALPIWTSPHVRANDQPLGSMNDVWFSQVLLDQSGFVVLHADEGGAPGAVLGYSDALPTGLSTGVSVTIEPSAVGNTVWAMLHYDTGTAGTYEFGEVEGADTPVLDEAGSPIMSSFVVLPPDQPTGPQAETTAATEASVTLTEWAIEMPTSLSAGTITFTVTNNGTQAHNFEIEGNGIEQDFETDLAPGETRTMEVELQPGIYEIYCPVAGHAELGMTLQLTVTE